MTGELTGRKVFAIVAAAFSVIIGVNVLMAVKAVSTFPGLEVANSYVASQSFDADRRGQVALGWTVTLSYAKGELRLGFHDAAGGPIRVASLRTTVGRATEAADDRNPDWAVRDGHYVAATDLDPGKWMILIEAVAADGTRFHQRRDLVIRG